MSNNQIFFLALAVVLLAGLIFTACKRSQKSIKPAESHVTHPDWSKNALIYEVNVRQYTPEGTFKAFEEHLPRLREMEVDIIWLMPIHPIGIEKRKGELGSYYSISDYTAVNPEFGDLDDLKNLVTKAHELGMFVILDWVANHTAWDHAWIEEHPEWYTRNETGEIVSPFDWSDVAKLNFEVPALRNGMIDAMKYWITEADIDGFRCDVAGEVPVDFWNRAREELDKIKLVFMLAEAEEPVHHEYAFDMSYAWELHHLMNSIAKRDKSSRDLDDYFKKHSQRFPEDAYRMSFITNHDENSWNGTEYERMGEAVNTFAMLTYTLPGMPMIYSGQEAAFDRRLPFFSKDSIEWNGFPLAEFYTQLGRLRKENPALWSGASGGQMKRLKTSDDKSIFAFMRRKDDNAVIVLANLSDQPKEFSLKHKGKEKDLTDWFSGEKIIMGPAMTQTLQAWQYRVMVVNIK